MEYTQGEWKTVKDKENRIHIMAFHNGLEQNIAILSVRSVDQVEANAYLISAAPAMYEALKKLTETELNADVLRILSPWFDKVERIIAKAEGKE